MRKNPKVSFRTFQQSREETLREPTALLWKSSEKWENFSKSRSAPGWTHSDQHSYAKCKAMWFKTFTYRLVYFLLLCIFCLDRWPTTQPAYSRKLELGSLEILSRKLSQVVNWNFFPCSTASSRQKFCIHLIQMEFYFCPHWNQNQSGRENLSDFYEVLLDD